jgi:hypothetical protein
MANIGPGEAIRVKYVLNARKSSHGSLVWKRRRRRKRPGSGALPASSPFCRFNFFFSPPHAKFSVRTSHKRKSTRSSPLCCSALGRHPATRRCCALQDSRAGKQPEGTGTTEKGKQLAAQKKRTRTTRQATQTQPLLLAADAFAAALVPAEDWCRTWAAGRTIVLRRTSKRVKEVVDKMLRPAVVRLSMGFWYCARNSTEETKLQFVLRQLAAMTARRITTLELPKCDMKGQDAERLAGVLAHCPALAHIKVGYNQIEAAGAESLAGVLVQCTALAHLDLCGNQIGEAGAERLAGVLGQCPALAHLDIRYNGIGTVGEGRLRASWSGLASGLRLN